jgi:hypothetical protein
MLADSNPAWLGLKLTEIVQVAPDASVVPQVFDTRKSDAALPETAIPESAQKDIPVFVRDIVFAELAVDNPCWPKSIDGTLVINDG